MYYGDASRPQDRVTDSAMHDLFRQHDLPGDPVLDTVWDSRTRPPVLTWAFRRLARIR